MNDEKEILGAEFFSDKEKIIKDSDIFNCD